MLENIFVSILIFMVLTALLSASIYIIISAQKNIQAQVQTLQMLSAMMKLLTQKFELKYDQCLQRIALIVEDTAREIILYDLIPIIKTEEFNIYDHRQPTYQRVIEKISVKSLEKLDSYVKNNILNYITEDEMINYISRHTIKVFNKFLAKHALTIKETGSNHMSALSFILGSDVQQLKKRKVINKQRNK